MSTTPMPSDIAAKAAETAQEAPKPRETPMLDKLLGIDEQAKAEAPAESKEEPAKAAEKKPEPVDKEAYEKALTSIRRAKLPEKLWSSMDAASVVELGGELAKQQAAADELSRELGELRKAAEAKPKAEESKPEKGKEQPSKPIELDLGAFAQDFPEHADGLKRAFEKAVSIAEARAQQALEEKLGALGLDRLTRDVTNLQIEKARAELQGRFPQLGDAERFKAVTGVMERLIKSGEYDSFQSLMNDAAAITFADDVREVSKEAANKAETKARDRGQAAVNGKVKASDGPSLYERRIAKLAEIEKSRG